jgi:hypothetical protein
MSTKDIDRGRKKILREIKQAKDAYCDVGYFGDKKEHEGDISIVGVAAVQEFGSTKRNIPERPFLRTTADEKRSSWTRMLDKSMSRVLQGKTNVVSALTGFGEIAAGEVRKKITAIKTPPKSEATIKREGAGFTNPLIWLGWMRAYCRSRIVVSGRVKHVTKEQR